MNEYYIRKDLPSIKVDKELVNHLEKYILSDIPEIIGIDKKTILDKYSIEIVDSLGSGKFNSISEFPLSLFQDGTKKITLGFSVYNQSFCSVKISFSIEPYSSIIDISLKSTNPREIAQGIYNGILEYINQHKTYNFIFHKIFFGIIGAIGAIGIGLGIGIGLITVITPAAVDKNYLWASSLLTLGSIIIIFFAYKGPKLKPYSEFLTKRQIRYNRIFSFFIWGFISYLIFGLGFGLLKDVIIK